MAGVFFGGSQILRGFGLQGIPLNLANIIFMNPFIFYDNLFRMFLSDQKFRSKEKSYVVFYKAFSGGKI